MEKKLLTEKEAAQLYQNIEVTLKAAGNRYNLNHVDDPGRSTSEKKVWSGIIRPSGILIPIKQKFMEYDTEVESEDGLILTSHPAEEAVNNLNTVVKGALACNISLDVTLSIKPVTLSHAQLRKVKAAIERLRSYTLDQVI